jgi:hypothetical protein
LQATLRRHRTRQREERLAAREKWHEHGLVFSTMQGKPMIARNVSQTYQRALAKAGLPQKRFYDLRHTCEMLF